VVDFILHDPITKTLPCKIHAARGLDEDGTRTPQDALAD
jgi:hypothetical protein